MLTCTFPKLASVLAWEVLWPAWDPWDGPALEPQMDTTHPIQEPISLEHFSLHSLSLSGSRCCDVDQQLKTFWEIDNSGTYTGDIPEMTEDEAFAFNRVK